MIKQKRKKYKVGEAYRIPKEVSSEGIASSRKQVAALNRAVRGLNALSMNGKEHGDYWNEQLDNAMQLTPEELSREVDDYQKEDQRVGVSEFLGRAA